MLQSICSHQQQEGEEAIKDVVLVWQVAFPAKGKDFHAHFKHVKEDEAQIDDLVRRENDLSVAIQLFIGRWGWLVKYERFESLNLDIHLHKKIVSLRSGLFRVEHQNGLKTNLTDWWHGNIASIEIKKKRHTPGGG